MILEWFVVKCRIKEKGSMESCGWNGGEPWAVGLRRVHVAVIPPVILSKSCYIRFIVAFLWLNVNCVVPVYLTASKFSENHFRS